MDVSVSEVTRLLAHWSHGDQKALKRLMPLVFEDLRRLARSQFREESSSARLQPTALVSEVYTHLTDLRYAEWENRSQFFSFAALLMRRILVEHAKVPQEVKRGGKVEQLPGDEAWALAEQSNVDILSLDNALDRLAEIDPRPARIVELRFFVGLRIEEVAELLEVSVTTVKHEWRVARLWLYRAMAADETEAARAGGLVTTIERRRDHLAVLLSPAPSRRRQLLANVKKDLRSSITSSGVVNITTARTLVESLHQGLNSLTVVLPSHSSELASRALLQSYRSFEALWHREIDLAAMLLAEALADEARNELGVHKQDFREAIDFSAAELELSEREALARISSGDVFTEVVAAEVLALFTQAVTEQLTRETAEGRARAALRSLMTHLQLGQDEIGRLFGVSGETVRRWERGKTTIPVARETEILQVEAGLSRLLEMFRLDRLPLVMRREADLFEGDSALEWILRGRIHEVADRYETTFRYQD